MLCVHVHQGPRGAPGTVCQLLKDPGEGQQVLALAGPAFLRDVPAIAGPDACRVNSHRPNTRGGGGSTIQKMKTKKPSCWQRSNPSLSPAHDIHSKNPTQNRNTTGYPDDRLWRAAKGHTQELVAARGDGSQAGSLDRPFGTGKILPLFFSTLGGAAAKDPDALPTKIT